jgi:hypothetical protein
MFPVRGFVKMYHFAIDFEAKMLYPLAPPQGWQASLIFEKEQLAIGNWQFARTQNLTTDQYG